MSRRCAAGLLLLPLLLPGVAWGEAPPRPVRVATVVMVPPQPPLLLSGSVQAHTLAELGFRVGGKVVERPVEVGDHVRAGQVLARLDPADLALSLQASESAVHAAAAEAEQARANLARYAALGAASPAYLPSDYDRRLAASRMTEARLAQATRQYALARDQAAYGTLAADADGVITALPAEVGQVVTAGQAVARLAHADATDVVVDVPENRLLELRDAGDVVITLWAAPDHPLRGRVREVGALADPATRTYLVKVGVVDPPPELLALGMTATVRFAAPAAPAVAELPVTALTDRDGSPAVWVLDPARGRAALRLVSVAGYDRAGAMRLSAGVAAGEQVVTAGLAELNPDLPVVAWGGPAR